MKAFDTDILTEILAGNPAYAERIANVPLEEQSAPLVAIEEVLRGRLNVIRQAEAGILGERGVGGEGVCWPGKTAPSPPTPLPRVQGRGEQEISALGHYFSESR